MNLLVTGGAGFIGSNFIRFMLGQHEEVKIVNLDLLTYAGNLDNLREVKDQSRYVFIQGNIGDGPLVDEIMRKHRIEVIVNFAAESHVDRSIKNPNAFVETNVLGTQVLLEAARRHGVSKYVQISTDEVYGTLGDTGYFTEETPLMPNSPYSASKASADLLVRAYCETYDLPATITRCSNNYGPYQYPEKLIPLMMIRALRDEPLPVYGDGRNIRDWLHVEDHCAAIDLVIRRGRVGEVYNIGGHNEQRNIDIVRRILSILDKPESLIEHVEDRLGHDYRYAIDPTKITNELGWKPKYTFDTGLAATVEWYLKHRNWWEKLID